MLVKVCIKRRFQKGKVNEIRSLLKEFRSGAMNQPGYISGETLVSYEDPQDVLVIGTWASIESWDAWRRNKSRQELEKMLEIYQEGPTQYTTYVLGAPLES